MQWQFHFEPERVEKIHAKELAKWRFDQLTQRFIYSTVQNGLTVERNIHLRFAKLPSGKTHINQNPTLEMHVGAGQILRESLQAQLDLPLSMQGTAGAGNGPQDIESPMTGKVLKTLVGVGDKVEKGQSILTVEAMKMENQILSPISGKIESLLKKVGESVNSGELLAVVVPE